jgi:hypothetical protein|tara:strand:+ start:24 stop:197 length:174 start_codon:yes stop_codon:yes gene_type:complete
MKRYDINGIPYTYENKDELSFGTDFEDSWGRAMAYAHHVMTTPEFEQDMKEWLDKKD